MRTYTPAQVYTCPDSANLHVVVVKIEVEIPLLLMEIIQKKTCPSDLDVEEHAQLQRLKILPLPDSWNCRTIAFCNRAR